MDAAMIENELKEIPSEIIRELKKKKVSDFPTEPSPVF